MCLEHPSRRQKILLLSTVSDNQNELEFHGSCRDWGSLVEHGRSRIAMRTSCCPRAAFDGRGTLRVPELIYAPAEDEGLASWLAALSVDRLNRVIQRWK